MSVSVIQKGLFYIKEVQEVVLFGVMVDARLYAMFASSALYYVMFPMLGFIFTAFAFINLYQLVQAKNRHAELYFNFIVSAIQAFCAGTSLYGGVIATLMGTTFALGPLFFQASILFGVAHQGLMLGLNLTRAYQAPKDSALRKHYLQAAMNNLFILALLGILTGTVVFCILAPVSPYLAAGFAMATVAITLMAMGWRLAPDSLKQRFKKAIGLGKPVHEPEPVQDDYGLCCSSDVQALRTIDPLPHAKLFVAPDYSEIVRRKPTYAQKCDSVLFLIERKISELSNVSGDKALHKKAFLECLKRHIEGNRLQKSSYYYNRFQADVFHSFLRDKSDTARILDAAMLLYPEAHKINDEDRACLVKFALSN